MHDDINRIIACRERRTRDGAQPAIDLDLVRRDVSSSLVHHEGARAGGTYRDGKWSYSSRKR